MILSTLALLSCKFGFGRRILWLFTGLESVDVLGLRHRDIDQSFTVRVQGMLFAVSTLDQGEMQVSCLHLQRCRCFSFCRVGSMMLSTNCIQHGMLPKELVQTFIMNQNDRLNASASDGDFRLPQSGIMTRDELVAMDMYVSVEIEQSFTPSVPEPSTWVITCKQK